VTTNNKTLINPGAFATNNSNNNILTTIGINNTRPNALVLGMRSNNAQIISIALTTLKYPVENKTPKKQHYHPLEVAKE
jgi:hypothetical protein